MKRILLTSFALLMVAILSIVSCKKKENDPAPLSNTSPANQVTDSRDGKTYKTVTIGNQTWMAENLDYQDPSAGTVYCYADEADSCVKYGGLYNWDAANVACPNGWRLPSDRDWQTLEFELGMSEEDTSATSFRGTDEGTKLKEGGSVGFNGKLTGAYFQDTYLDYSIASCYWTSATSIISSTKAYYRVLSSQETGIMRGTYDKAAGFCVRCLKN